MKGSRDMLEKLKSYTEDLKKCEDEFNSILTKTEILLDDILRDFFQMGLDKNYKNNSWKKILEQEIEKGYQDRNSKRSFVNAWKAITNFGIEKYGVQDMDTSLIVALISKRNSPFACCACSEQIRSLLMGHLREDRNIFAHKGKRISYELEVRQRIVANTIEHCREFTFAVRDVQNGETIPLEDVRIVYQEKYRDKLNALEFRNKKAYKEYNLLIAKSELEKNSEESQTVDKSNIVPLGINRPNIVQILDGSAKIEKAKFHGKPALLISRRDGKIKVDRELYFWCVVDKEKKLGKKYDKGGAYYQLTKECIGKYIYGYISSKGYKGRLEIKYGPVSEKDFLQDMDSTSVVEDNGGEKSSKNQVTIKESMFLPVPTLPNENKSTEPSKPITVSIHESNLRSREIILPYEMKRLVKKREFFTSSSLVHYFVRPNDYFVLNSLELLMPDSYLYRLLKQSNFEYIYFVEIESTECVIYAYDTISQNALYKEKNKAIEEETVSGLSNPSRVSSEKIGSSVENIREYGKRRVCIFSVGEDFGVQFAATVKNALDNPKHKTAIVIPISFFGKEGYCTDSVINTLGNLGKHNLTENALIITLPNKSDFLECFKAKQLDIHDWINAVLDEAGSSNREKLDYAVNLLLKHGRLLTASKYGADEFANLLFRKKIIEKNEWFSSLNYTKIYAIAESLRTYLIDENSLEVYKTIEKFKGSILKELNRLLDKKDVCDEIKEKANFMSPVRLGYSDEINSLCIERVFHQYSDRYENID